MMAALSLGTLISEFTNNEFQMIQFIPLIIVAQVFISGLFSLDTMSVYLRWIGVVMPLKYGADALRNIMIRGAGWDRIWMDVTVLAAFVLEKAYKSIRYFQGEGQLIELPAPTTTSSCTREPQKSKKLYARLLHRESQCTAFYLC
jgi:hypothetical protein